MGFPRRSSVLQTITAACISAFLTFGACPTACAAAYDAHPKLVVVIVIDQFRGDYMERYRADFKPNGFRLFQDKGSVFSDCYYDYANTKTGPGHATIGTGAYSDGHGIADNQWWDLARNTKRPVSAVEDDRYVAVTDPAICKGGCPGASPRNLMASTVGDELRLATQGGSRVYGVSLRDSSAILAAGAAANGAFWMDVTSGRFITSTFYMSALPQWALDFNSSDAAHQAAASADLDNVTNFYEQVGETPSANTYELAFAKALIQGEQLGKHATTDMITISLSANDIAGHIYGPDSTQERQMVDGLDTDLDGFFGWLDKYLESGLGSSWIAVTADHGIAPAPQVANALGLPAADVNMDRLIAGLNAAMNAKFSPGEKVAYVLPQQQLPYISLDSAKFDRAGINEQEAEEAARDALPGALANLAGTPTKAVRDATSPDATSPEATSPAAQVHRDPAPPTLAHVYTRVQMAKGEYPLSEFGTLLAHSYSQAGGWYVMAMLEAFQMEGSDPTHTTHYSPYSYDRHVPLAFFGAPFAHGTYHGRVGPVDLAATFASLLGINQPSSSTGRVLTQALRAPVYPVAEPKTVRRGRAGKAVHSTGDAVPAAGTTSPPDATKDSSKDAVKDAPAK